MPDPRFYRRAGALSVARLAEIAGVALPAGIDPTRSISDVAPLEAATSGDLAFISDKSFAAVLAATQAGVCLTTPALASQTPAHTIALPCADPRAAYAQIAHALYPDLAPAWPNSSAIDPSAKIAANAQLAPNVTVGAGAEIGARVKIGPQSVIGPGVVVDDDTVIGANVTLTFCMIGKRVIIHPGVQIGQDGFGFYAAPTGPKKVPQLGRVLVHDDVEIGANCTIDRGTLADTIIGRGCKLDNLVQIGHNVVMGQGCIMVAQSGIAGSCTIGDGVIIGGQVGIADHVTIGAGAQIASQSGVMRDVGAKEKVMGYPAKPILHFWREIAALAKLAKRG